MQELTTIRPVVRVGETASGPLVALTGELDVYARDDIRAAFYDRLDPASGKDVIVDLSDAAFIDSTVLGELFAFRTWLRRRGRELTIACSSRELLRTFEVSGLDRVLTIVAAPE